ncbi:glycosyltransferase [Rathayibacter sp. VKM Ac-2803]|uniref:glycosyltransferase family 4 protein n=1 Tax=unclassified Rathayibacter TaxID=2609250 RepID=UPI0013570279|nr:MULTISPECIES: glycosyltransferase family 1 protein [unclassified Rathayibacter]MWV50576.1 glycosyltransferase [Rathayibacter sp. VKM Ac-2803]MWV59577.1 glycosyltransferase [Rathayibacter sp. VKM Ac-2754]
MSRRVRLRVDATPLAAEALTGVGVVLLETVRALADPRFAGRVETTLFAPFSERAAVARRAPDGVRVRGVPLPRRVFGLLTRTPLPIDVLIGRGVYFFPNFRNWRTLSPSITFVHDVCFAAQPAMVPEERRRFLRAHVPGWLRRTSLVATGTPSAAREIEQLLGVGADRIRVLPTTVDSGVFRPRPREEERAVAGELQVDRYLLFVGAREPRKNLPLLIRSYAAADRPVGHTLLLVGATGWDDGEIVAEVRSATEAGADVRIVTRPIPAEVLPALISGAEALVLVSHHEGFGLPALEAVASGTPVIASDVPGIRDALAGHEDAAVFVDPERQDELVQALEIAMAAPRRVDPGRIRPWTDAAEVLVRTAEELAA